MLGFIKKDLYSIKSNIKIYSLIFVAYAILGLQKGNSFAIFPAFFSVILFMSTFSYDEFNKWNAYSSTFPNGRKNLVKAKYLSALVFLFSVVALSEIISLVIGLIQQNFKVSPMLSDIVMSCTIVMIIQAITLPFIFKFGVEKQRIIFVVIMGAGAALIAASSSLEGISIISNFIYKHWMVILLSISIVGYFISYKISERIFLKKEL